MHIPLILFDSPLLSEVIIHGGCHRLQRLEVDDSPSFPALEKLHIAPRSPIESLGGNVDPIILPHLKLLSVYHPQTIPLHALHAPQLVELRLTQGRFPIYNPYMTVGHNWGPIKTSLLKHGSPDPFPQLRIVRMEARLSSSIPVISLHAFVWAFIDARPHIRVLWYTAVGIEPDSNFKIVGSLLTRMIHLEELHLSFSARSGLRNISGVWIEGFLEMWLAMRGLLARAEALKLWWSLKAPEPELEVERMCAELSSEYPGRFITIFTGA